MSTTTERSATIYQFPARGRFAVSTQHDEPAAASLAPRVKTVSGSAWYHEEAVAEERNLTN